MKFINILKNDINLHNDSETSKIVIQYCDEIMESRVIKDTITYMPYTMEKVKKD